MTEPTESGTGAALAPSDDAVSDTDDKGEAPEAIAQMPAAAKSTPARKAKGNGTKRKSAPILVAAAGPKLQAPQNSHSDERVRVAASVERTDGVLRTVHSKVVKSFNRKAREDFDHAAGLQREAREALNQNLYARSDRLTQESRTLARQVAVHLGPPQDDPDYVGMALDRTDDAIGRAKEVLRDAGGADERQRLETLERRQRDARRHQREGSTRKAYAATREVRDGILTILRDCDNLPVRAETAERALKRADRAMEQAKTELGDRPTLMADRLARNARDQMAKARTAFFRKNYRDTLIYSKLAERDLELAVNAQRGPKSRNG